MPSDNMLRIDKWLWAVRIFKSRSIASDACKNNKVLIDSEAVKPSRSIKIGDIVLVKKNHIIYSLKVTGLLAKRQSATIAVENYEDITSEEELMKLDAKKYFSFEKRERGSGRPTKKERRVMDSLKGISKKSGIV